MKTFRKRTGLVLDAYFSGAKCLASGPVEGARERANRGELKAGTIDSYLVWMLTGGDVHVTDVSNASRTLLMDLETLRWDSELCELLNVPENILPEVRSSAEVYGVTRGVAGLPDGIPIAGMAGDSNRPFLGKRVSRQVRQRSPMEQGLFCS